MTGPHDVIRATVPGQPGLQAARQPQSSTASTFRSPAPRSAPPQIFDSRAAFRRLANELEEIFKAHDFNMVGAARAVDADGAVRAAGVAPATRMLSRMSGAPSPRRRCPRPAGKPACSLATAVRPPGRRGHMRRSMHRPQLLHLPAHAQLPARRWQRQQTSQTACTAGTSLWAALTPNRHWRRHEPGEVDRLPGGADRGRVLCGR